LEELKHEKWSLFLVYGSKGSLWGNEREKECFCEEEMGKRGLFLAAAAAALLLLLLLPFCCCKGEERKREREFVEFG